MPDGPAAEPAPPAYVGPARLAVALVQGGALLWLHRALQPWTEARPDAAFHAALIVVACGLPPVILFGLGRLRARTLVAWGLVAAALLAGLAVHDVLRLPAERQDAAPSGAFVFYAAAMLFIAHALVAAADQARRPLPDYRVYFEVAWLLGLRLALAALFVGLFWLLLWLGAAMFGLIGLRFLSDLLGHDWFNIPATALMLGAAIHLTDMREDLVRAMRALVLNLLSWLLPVMVALAIGFLVALPFTGLGPLWAVKRATAILLVASAALVVLINTAFQDGRAGTPAQGMLRLPVRAAALVLAPLAGLAAYGLWLRVDQHGLTPDRVGAGACVLMALAYAGGYAGAALWPARWATLVERTNVAAALVAIGLIVALFSPLADPARLSVADQMRRLADGRVTPEAFDYAFLAHGAAGYGRAALAALKTGRGSPAAQAIAARAADALRPPPGEDRQTPAQRAATMPVWPKGAVLPADFLAQDWRADRDDAPQCLTGAAAPCCAILADLDGDGRNEVLLGAPYRFEAYRREAAGWRLAGLLVGPFCQDAKDALRDGRYAIAAPLWKDLMIGGRRFVLNPEQRCD